MVIFSQLIKTFVYEGLKEEFILIIQSVDRPLLQNKLMNLDKV